VAQHLGLAGGRKTEGLAPPAVDRDEVIEIALGHPTWGKLRAAVGMTAELVYEPFGTTTTGVGAYLVWFDRCACAVAGGRARRGLIGGRPVGRLFFRWVGALVGGHWVSRLVGGRGVGGLVGGQVSAST
jgi:hypothetical protein